MLHVDQILQNRYRIIRILGQGGMGAVYQAQDLSLDVACVVKEMTPPVDPTQVKNTATQFQREGKALASLRHLSLPRVTNYFSESGYYYLVMDLIAGRSLESILDNGALPESVVLKYGDQLLDVLSYIHSQGVLHRDIKPANIIIQPDDRAVLVDFGLVKLLTSGATSTKTLVSALSPQYAPPEQYTGNADQRSDLYSLAATLYQALAGHPPSSATDQMSGVRLMPLRQLPHLTTPISPNTEYVLMKALSLDRATRYQDAASMRSDLMHGAGKVYNAAAATQVLSSSTVVLPGPGAPAQGYTTGVPVPMMINTGAGTNVNAAASGRKPLGTGGIIAAIILTLAVIAAAAAVVVITGNSSTAIPAAVVTTAAPATTSAPTAANSPTPTTTATPAPSATTQPSQTPTPTDTPVPASSTPVDTDTPTPTPRPSLTPRPTRTPGPSPLPATTAAPVSPGMLFPAPVLLEPPDGFPYTFPSVPTLKWSPVAGLGPNDYYLVEITHQQGVDPMYTQATSTPPRNYIVDLPRDPYLWRVTVVRKTGDSYVAVSPPSAQLTFRWTKPKATSTPKPKK